MKKTILKTAALAATLIVSGCAMQRSVDESAVNAGWPDTLPQTFPVRYSLDNFSEMKGDITVASSHVTLSDGGVSLRLDGQFDVEAEDFGADTPWWAEFSAGVRYDAADGGAYLDGVRLDAHRVYGLSPLASAELSPLVGADLLQIAQLMAARHPLSRASGERIDEWHRRAERVEIQTDEERLTISFVENKEK